MSQQNFGKCFRVHTNAKNDNVKIDELSLISIVWRIMEKLYCFKPFTYFLMNKQEPTDIICCTFIYKNAAGVKVKEGSIHVSHSAAAHLINKLSDLTSKHSDVLEAEEEAKNAFDNVLKNHTQLKLEIDKTKEINDNYQRQLDVLQEERNNLQANVSALGETETYSKLIFLFSQLTQKTEHLW